MSPTGLSQFFFVVVALLLTAPVLGKYMARVYDNDSDLATPPATGNSFFATIERNIYRASGIDASKEQRWNVYAISLLAFSAVSFLVVYGIQRLQGSFPFNPTHRNAVSPWGAFNVAASFVTNTNWQWYGGEGTMSHLTQMIALTVQNFVSAAAGMTVVVAVIRGITRKNQPMLGNFWVDLVRTTVRILLPISFAFALVLGGLGVIQNLNGYTKGTPIDATVRVDGVSVSSQSIPGGPVASQEAIKQLGSNGGGFYNANSAHPFENPTPWTNVVEFFAILLIPIALCFTYGAMVDNKRQGTVLLGVMLGIWVFMTFLTSFAEVSGNKQLTLLGVDQSSDAQQIGGNMEGKEIRFGPSICSQWAAATTGTSNGSVNCMHDSFTPLGGGVSTLHMMLGEVSPGGVGVGLYGGARKRTAGCFYRRTDGGPNS
jgi:potassium-transporting ATPase potassium-binding subunit